MDIVFSAPDEWFVNQIKLQENIFDRNVYDSTLAIFWQRKKDKRLALDIGAHVGTWSVALGNIFENVISVEGCLENYNYLLNNLAKNEEKTTNIIPIYKLLSDKIEKVSLDRGLDNSGQYYITPDVNGNLETTTLDLLISESDYSKVDLIKIDVEGAEYKVLLGAKNILLKSSPIIVFELNGLLESRYNTQYTELADFLLSLDYILVKKLYNDEIWAKRY